jgi:predicted fused transcriptional regulator/phosphomethylpyrimidine kinase/predicted transcriptional regulator
LRPPCELVVKHYLPVIRSLIARELVDTYDLNQMQIAKLLGITQPAVSNYLSLMRGEAEKTFDTAEVREVARKMASELVEGKLSMSQSIYTICKLCIKLRSAGVTCGLHKETVPELSTEECKVCLELFTEEAEPISERVNTINNIRAAISKLSESKEFLSVIPEVRTNLVMATSNAQTVSEVVGIPGRIIVARERLKTLSEPEFGASFHLANVLLAAREKNKEIRAAINILFNERIERAMRVVLNMEIYKFNRASLPSEAADKNMAVAWAVRKATNELGKTPDAIVDEGGYGVEPTTYIFGSSALDVADRSIRIAKALSN